MINNLEDRLLISKSAFFENRAIIWVGKNFDKRGRFHFGIDAPNYSTITVFRPDTLDSRSIQPIKLALKSIIKKGVVPVLPLMIKLNFTEGTLYQVPQHKALRDIKTANKFGIGTLLLNKVIQDHLKLNTDSLVEVTTLIGDNGSELTFNKLPFTWEFPITDWLVLNQSWDDVATIEFKNIFVCRKCSTPIRLSNRSDATMRVNIRNNNSLYIKYPVKTTLTGCTKCKNICRGCGTNGVICTQCANCLLECCMCYNCLFCGKGHRVSKTCSHCGRCSVTCLCVKRLLPRASLKSNTPIDISKLREVGIELELSKLDTTRNCPSGWRYVTDTSCNAGYELVSEILTDDLLIPGLATLKKHISSPGMSINPTRDSCGLHLHLNSLNLDYIGLRNLVLLWTYHLEEISLRWARPIRPRQIEYCCRWKGSSSLEPLLSKLKDSFTIKNIKELFISTLYRRIKPKDVNSSIETQVKSLTMLIRERYGASRFGRVPHTRYRTMNIHAWFRMGTIEFRFMDATEDVEQILKYIQFFNGIINLAHFIPPKEVTEDMDVFSYLSKYVPSKLLSEVKEAQSNSIPINTIEASGSIYATSDEAEEDERSVFDEDSIDEDEALDEADFIDEDEDSDDW